ncbi:hypothetical protein MHK_006908, partial [Candidatus Magnetomorum sp. HK-1]
AVTTEKMLDLAVTTKKLADNAVSSEKIIDAVVTENKLSDSVKQQLSSISDNTQSILANAKNITLIQQNIYDSLSTKADRSDLDQKANIEDVYNQASIDDKFEEKADKTDLDLKADQSDLELKADKTLLNLKADKNQVYTRGQLMTRTEIEELTREKVENSSVYDRETIDNKLSEKIDSSQLALKADISSLELKADKDQVYTRGQLLTRNEIEDITSKKADSASVYDRVSIDQKFTKKADLSELSLKADVTALDTKADKDQVYTRGQLLTRTEIEDITSKKVDTTLVYDRATIDSKLSQKADQSQLALKADQSALDLKADQSKLTLKAEQSALDLKADQSSIYTR